MCLWVSERERECVLLHTQDRKTLKDIEREREEGENARERERE